MEKRIYVKIKVLPPFTLNLKSVESILHLDKDYSLIELFSKASSQGILKIDNVVDNGGIRDNVVVLVNGKTIFDLRYRLSDGDRVVVMPLAPGG
uniref:MoaD/ThiS family protein n=2 Tax=Ignisphaera aggregans TaxID=334771 RepID=A0A7C5XNG0_9CREN